MFGRLALALERIALTLWVGGLWVTGYVAAPLFFATLGDRSLAGDIAGHLFQAMSGIGLMCGALLLGLGFGRARMQLWREWRTWLLVLMIVLTLVGEFVLFPAVQAVRQQAGLALAPGHPLYGRFSLLHGIASVLFLINSLIGLVLVASPALGRRKQSDGA